MDGFSETDRFINAFYGKEEKAHRSDLYMDIWGGAIPGFPVTLKIKIRNNVQNGISFSSFISILSKLDEQGFTINNSFCEVNLSRGAVESLEGGLRFDVSEYIHMRNLNNHEEHLRHKCRNHIMGIYCCDSIKKDFLSENQRLLITEICGKENVQYINDNFVFSVVPGGIFTPLYRITEREKIRKTREIIKKPI